MMTSAITTVFSVEEIDDVLVITPQGTSQNFRYNDIHRESNALIDRLRREKARHLVFDFGSVEILCSIMINAVIRVARQHDIQKGTSAFCAASPSMRDVIHNMNLTRLWPYFDTREDAVESFDI